MPFHRCIFSSFEFFLESFWQGVPCLICLMCRGALLFFYPLLSFAIVICVESVLLDVVLGCPHYSRVCMPVVVFSRMWNSSLFSYLLCGSCLVHLIVSQLWTFIVLLFLLPSELGTHRCRLTTDLRRDHCFLYCCIAFTECIQLMFLNRTVKWMCT